jgi:hypothetical protein
MEFLALVLGLVIGGVSVAIYYNHKREKEWAARSEFAPMSFAQIYAYTCDKFSQPGILRLRQTHTLTRAQKELLAVLGDSTDIVEAVREMSRFAKEGLPKFAIDFERTEFDRNGNVELWVDVSDDVSEVYYFPSERLSVITDVINTINLSLNKQLLIMTKGTMG